MAKLPLHADNFRLGVNALKSREWIYQKQHSYFQLVILSLLDKYVYLMGLQLILTNPHNYFWTIKLFTLIAHKELSQLEFSLNEFHRILQIQWIMTKSKHGMVTRGITYFMTETFPAIVIENTFFTISGYVPQATLNRYLPRCSNNNFFFPTSSGNYLLLDAQDP